MRPRGHACARSDQSRTAPKCRPGTRLRVSTVPRGFVLQTLRARRDRTFLDTARTWRRARDWFVFLISPSPWSGTLRPPRRARRGGYDLAAVGRVGARGVPPARGAVPLPYPARVR